MMEAFYTARWAIVKKAYEAATVERVAEVVRRARDGRRGGAAVLLGAGVSVSAGIPSATGVIDDIRKLFPTAFDGCANKKSYPVVMACLSTEERRELIKGYVNNANINWAYIAIAEMIKAGYVEYVLTTNFDPLLSRACALIGQFPAIYDLAVSSEYPTAAIDGPAIFHLHGQHSGFALMNTEKEVQKNAKRMREVFKKVDTSRPWIVCGYSGECDPVVDQLVRLRKFHGNLFWAGYGDSEPSLELQKKLFSDSQHRWVSGYDADGFFTALAQKLDDLQPGYVTNPFTHLLNLIKPVMEFSPAAQKSAGPSGGVMERARGKIQQAIDQFEMMGQAAPGGSAGGDVMSTDPTSSLITDDEAIRLYLAGKHATLLERVEGAAQPPTDSTKALAAISAVKLAYESCTQALASADDREATLKAGLQYALKAQQISPSEPWAYLVEADCLAALAAEMTGRECDQYYKEAFTKYEKSTEIRPDFYEAFNNWGSKLGDFACTKDGPEREALYQEAFAKYARAMEIKPDKHEAFYNWGNDLADLARTKGGPERDALLQEAFAKYARATEIKPDVHEAFNNWGNKLGDFARTKDGPERDALFQEAFAKYTRAVETKPDFHQALNNWGSDLGALARTKDGPEREALLREAFVKYARAIEIKPDYYDALTNWGISLGELARTKDGPERDALYQEAFAKYARATEVKPDKHGAFNGWGGDLAALATTKEGQERERLLAEAEQHLTRAYSLHPAAAAYNMACLAAIRGQPDKARGYLEEGLALGTLPDRAHLESDTDLDSLRELPWFKELLEKASRG